MKCDDSCTTVIDTRSGEGYCYAHGTTNFVRQAWDAVDVSDLNVRNEYSDKFIVNAYKAFECGYFLSVDDLAKELGISVAEVYLVLSRNNALVSGRSASAFRSS